jgi:hypothetical protein
MENQFICCEGRNVDDDGGGGGDDDDKHRRLIHLLIFVYTSIPYP